MSYVPFLFISALTGQRVNKLYEMIKEVAEKNAIRVTTGVLKRPVVLRHGAGTASVG